MHIQYNSQINLDALYEGTVYDFTYTLLYITLTTSWRRGFTHHATCYLHAHFNLAN